MTPYQRGFEDGKLMAVEAIGRAALSLGHVDVGIMDAIRAIEPPGEETHEERWAAAGWPFKWSDDVRGYHVLTGKATDGAVMWCGPDAGWHTVLPTVQAVDAWIAAHGKGE
ncbi:MAG: hypothetical protein M0R22_13145 [Dehalococcoidia bacterium]|nr:hypothetical protein [Dehalococcoidia bacterium]